MSTRRRSNKKQPRKPFARVIPIALLLFVAVGLLGLVAKVGFSQASKYKASDLITPTSDPDERWDFIMTDLIGQTRHFKGPPDAPVTVLEFSDFQ